MKFNEQDTKAFFIGMIASMSAVIAWDVIKKSLKIFNYEVKDTNGNTK